MSCGAICYCNPCEAFHLYSTGGPRGCWYAGCRQSHRCDSSALLLHPAGPQQQI